MVEVATEEKVIFHAQHLDLIYSQLGTPCDIIPNSPWYLMDPKKPTPRPHDDGVVVGTGADPGFNATTTHQQNPNYRPFRQHL
jgi:hypothetical protein